MQHAAIARIRPRRQQHLRLPAITCDKHCNVYNRRLRRSALYQPTVTSLQTEQLRALSMGAPAFYSHATRKGHTHSPLLATTATGRSINISSQIVFSAISYTLRRPSMKGISSVVYPRSTVLSLRGKFQRTLSLFASAEMLLATYDYIQTYRVAQKSKPQSFVHIFAKY